MGIGACAGVSAFPIRVALNSLINADFPESYAILSSFACISANRFHLDLELLETLYLSSKAT